MMLALLIYGYADGVFSSRKIERATYRDVSVSYLTDCQEIADSTLVFDCWREGGGAKKTFP